MPLRACSIHKTRFVRQSLAMIFSVLSQAKKKPHEFNMTPLATTAEQRFTAPAKDSESHNHSDNKSDDWQMLDGTIPVDSYPPIGLALESTCDPVLGNHLLRASPKSVHRDNCPPPIPSNTANLTPWTKSNILAVGVSQACRGLSKLDRRKNFLTSTCL